MNFLKRHKRQIDSAAHLAQAVAPWLGCFPACFGLANMTMPPFVLMLLFVLSVFNVGLQLLSGFLYVPPVPFEMVLFLDGDTDFSDTRHYAG